MQQIAGWIKKPDDIDASALENNVMPIHLALEVERVEGRSRREMIFQAYLLLLCPLMMTITVATLGAQPLRPGTGSGWELRRQLPLAIAGGLIVSRVIILFTISVSHLYFDRLAVSQRRSAPPRARGEALE
jgi:multidrug efflux pump subunit AcrB